MDWVWGLWRSNAPLTLAVVLFVAGLGVPSPASITIIATGALVKQGGAPLVPTVLAALAGSVLGSTASYQIGKRGLGRWLEKKRRKPAWAKAVRRFERDAWTTIFLSRWLLTPLGLPISYLSGSSRYPVPKYLSATVLGSLLWVLIYGGVGYAFADRWEWAYRQAERYGAIVLGVIAVGGVAWFLWRRGQKRAAEPASA